MAAAPNSLMHTEPTESTSEMMADQPPYDATDRTETSTLQVDDRIQPQAVAPAHFIQPLALNNDSKEAHQGAPSGNPRAIVPIGDPMYVTPLERLLEAPADIDCPFCHRRTRTRVTHNDSTATTLAGVLCCLLTCIGAFLPCMCGWCQDVDHHCSQCNHQVTHKPHDGFIQKIAPPEDQKVPSKYGYASQAQMGGVQQDAKTTA